MNGIEFLKLRKNDKSTTNVSFIFMRKPDDLIGVTQCFKQGVIDCLIKPVSVEQLYRVVQKTLEITPYATLHQDTPAHASG